MNLIIKYEDLLNSCPTNTSIHCTPIYSNLPPTHPIIPYHYHIHTNTLQPDLLQPAPYTSHHPIPLSYTYQYTTARSTPTCPLHIPSSHTTIIYKPIHYHIHTNTLQPDLLQPAPYTSHHPIPLSYTYQYTTPRSTPTCPLHIPSSHTTIIYIPIHYTPIYSNLPPTHPIIPYHYHIHTNTLQPDLLQPAPYTSHHPIPLSYTHQYTIIYIPIHYTPIYSNLPPTHPIIPYHYHIHTNTLQPDLLQPAPLHIPSSHTTIIYTPIHYHIHTNTLSYTHQYTIIYTPIHYHIHTNTLSYTHQYTIIYTPIHYHIHTNTLSYTHQYTIIYTPIHYHIHTNTLSYTYQYTIIYTPIHYHIHTNTLSYTHQYTIIYIPIHYTPIYSNLPPTHPIIPYHYHIHTNTLSYTYQYTTPRSTPTCPLHIPSSHTTIIYKPIHYHIQTNTLHPDLLRPAPYTSHHPIPLSYTNQYIQI